MYNTQSLLKALGKRELYPITVRRPDGSFERILTHDPGSLVHQVTTELSAKLKLGRGKRNDKHHNHGKPSLSILYSSGTATRYKRACVRFVCWLDPAKKIKYYKEARKYVPVYLRWLKKQGYAARYIKTEASALGKLYNCSYVDFGIKLPSAKRADRDFTVQNQQVTKFYLNNPELCMTILAFGMRHFKELVKLRAIDYRFGDSTAHVVGKNGRHRRAAVLPGLEYLVDEQIQAALDSDRIKPFCKIPKDAPVHHLRRIYACLFYLYLARPVEELPYDQCYVCRSELTGLQLDRAALWQVSTYMGHGRECVTVDYIAPFVKRDDDGALVIGNPLDLMPGAETFFRDGREVTLRTNAWHQQNEQRKEKERRKREKRKKEKAKTA